MPSIVQLSFDLPEPADERLERLLAEELPREHEDPSYGLLVLQAHPEEAGDAA
jgi:hypothetical protein